MEIGSEFRRQISLRGINRRILAKKLGYEYADNDRMICFRLGRADYLWSEREVELWCKAIGMSESSPIVAKLKSKAGKK